jgi:hypothetical protein
MCASPEDTLDLICKHNFPGSEPAKSEEDTIADINTLSDKIGEFPAISEDFRNKNKIKEGFASFDPYKAAGHDDIKPIVLKHLPDALTDRLVACFDACQTIGYTPTVWRHSKVVFIPKPNKPDYSVAKAFRPISLTPFLFKTLEKVSAWHIEDLALKNKPLSKNQHAFKKGSSTETAISQSISIIEKGMHGKGYSLAVYLDIKCCL